MSFIILPNIDVKTSLELGQDCNGVIHVVSEVLLLVAGVRLHVDEQVRQVLQQLLGGDHLRALGQLQLASQTETVDDTDERTGPIAVLCDDSTLTATVGDPLDVIDILVCLQIR